MAMDDINGGGGGSYTPNWKREEEERAWAAAREEERRKERVEEKESYSYNPGVAEVNPKKPAVPAVQAGKDYIKQNPRTYSEGDSGNYQTGISYPGQDLSPEAPDTPATPAAPAEERAEERTPVYNPPSNEPEPEVNQSQNNVQNQPVVYNAQESTTTQSKNNRKDTGISYQPVVFTNGTSAANASNRKALAVEAANRKSELTDDDEYILYQNFMALDAAAQREALKNPQVQQAIQNQGRRQAQRLRDEAMAASEARHTLGAGPTEPGTWQYTTATGPILPREGAVTVPGASGSGADYFSSNPAVRQYTPGTAEYEQAQAAAAARAILDQQNEIMGMTRVSDMTPAEQMRHQPGYSYVGFVPTAEGQEDFDTQVRILKGRGYPEETAVAMAQEEFGNYSYSGDQPSYVRRNVPEANVNPGAAMQSYLQEGRDQAAGQGLSGNDAENYAVTYANERMRVLQQAAQMTPQEEARRAGGPTSAYYYEPVPGTGSGSNYYAGPTEPRRSGEERAEERTQQYAPTAGGQETAVPTQTGGNQTRPGADAALANVMKNSGNRYVPDSVRFAQERAERTNDYLNRDQSSKSTGSTGSTGNSSTGNSGTGSSSNTGSNNGKQVGSYGKDKTIKFTPSYGQDMKQGVKAPYKKGGYSLEEIEKLGNAPRTDFQYNNGKPAYEGYYLAPDGHYYPVDQEKAAYYKANGSYRGWEEPMRQYYNTFGTFYGYRPDWKTAGGVNVWMQNRPQQRSYGYSYSGGGGGGGSNRSYGSGNTANNGLYWNPNTSWSI